MANHGFFEDLHNNMAYGKDTRIEAGTCRIKNKNNNAATGFEPASQTFALTARNPTSSVTCENEREMKNEVERVSLNNIDSLTCSTYNSQTSGKYSINFMCENGGFWIFSCFDRMKNIKTGLFLEIFWFF